MKGIQKLVRIIPRQNGPAVNVKEKDVSAAITPVRCTEESVEELVSPRISQAICAKIETKFHGAGLGKI